MEKLTDEELDSVFKNAAEASTPPFDPAAWDAMNQKLNAPRTLPVWRRWAPILLLVTAVFFTGVWVGKTSNEDGGQVESPANQSLDESNSGITNKHELDTNKELRNVTGLKDAENGLTNKESISQAKAVESRNQNLRLEENQNGLIVLNETKQEKFSDEVELLTVLNEVQQQDSIAEEEMVLDSIALIKAAVDSVDKSKELNDKPGGRRVYGLFIRLLASPDLSAIKFGPSQLGSNFGLVGELAFSEKFSLSTGVIRARKNYESYQEEAYGASARHLVGSCSILDIPLNLTYYFPSQSRFSAYATVGASSYVMLREDYIYTIKSNTGDRVYPYQAIRKNNEWFKVLNLAIGLQYKLAPRWQVQLEPFIKAPLADLGERNVRLSSMGVFGGLRYQVNSIIKTP